MSNTSITVPCVELYQALTAALAAAGDPHRRISFNFRKGKGLEICGTNGHILAMYTWPRLLEHDLHVLVEPKDVEGMLKALKNSFAGAKDGKDKRGRPISIDAWTHDARLICSFETYVACLTIEIDGGNGFNAPAVVILDNRQAVPVALQFEGIGVTPISFPPVHCVIPEPKANYVQGIGHLSSKYLSTVAAVFHKLKPNALLDIWRAKEDALSAHVVMCRPIPRLFFLVMPMATLTDDDPKELVLPTL